MNSCQRLASEGLPSGSPPQLASMYAPAIGGGINRPTILAASAGKQGGAGHNILHLREHTALDSPGLAKPQTSFFLFEDLR